MMGGGYFKSLNSEQFKSIINARKRINSGDNFIKNSLTGQKMPNTRIIDHCAGETGHIDDVGISIRSEKLK